jgi:hypothetical protein
MALSKIKTNSIADNAITSTKIGVDVIVAEDLASNSITVAEIASNAVTTAKIADANVTTDKLATTLTVTHALGSASTPSITFTGDTNTGIFSPAADTLAFAEGGVEVMRIDASGNVGINTTSPGIKLGVVDTSAGAATFPTIIGNRGTTVGTQVNFGLQTYDAGSAGITNVIGSVTTSASSGAGSADMVFQTTSSGTRAERMRITAAGVVSKTMTADGIAFQVKGSYSGNPSLIELGQSSSDAYLQLWDATRSTSTKLQPWSSGINWFTGSSGFGGTTTTATYPISVSQGVPVGSGGNAKIKIGNHVIRSQANDDLYLYGYNGETTGALLYVGGYYTFSARSIKSNIVKLENSLDKICQLNGYSYTITETGRDDIGLIADEVEAVFPDLVSHNDETGEPNSVDYTSLVAVLIEAVKELKAEFDEYKRTHP